MTNASFEDRLTAYAELLVRVGVNVQPGQKLLVRASTESAPLVRKVAEIAYRIGSPLVDVHWNDDGVTRARFLHGPEGSFSTITEWRAKAMIQLAEEGAASLAITSDDPDMLAGTDPDRFSAYVKAWRPAVKPYSDLAMNDRIAWSVAAAAAPAWAKRVFPDLSEADAVAKLWDAIFAATRIDEPDPVGAWRAHTDRLKAMKGRLNEQRFAALRFRAPGTDLRVGLADGHVWDGGVSRTPDGTEFVANMPTEEVFTAPHRAQVDGVVRASMPLSYNGTIIDDFELTFEAGRVVKANAGTGQKALDNILDTDEGSRRLGEVALVPASSPIAKTGLLFLETLFDENAACHIALGKAYGLTVRGSDDMTPEQRAEVGMNESLSHVDFMIGSPEMDVDGERADGELVPVLREGEWVH
ncbi:MAG: aminopeptidase [Trueperaceae bacterium]